MGKWGDIYRERARRVRPVIAQQNTESGRLVLEGGRRAVRIELYERSNLPVSRRLYRSISLQVMSNGFIVGFDTSIAPHARRRLAMTGTSKSGGHRLDMDPSRYVRANIFPRMQALNAIRNRKIIGTKRTVVLR